MTDTGETAHRIQAWTLATDALSEDLVEPWKIVLDAQERERAARFVFPRHRVQFVAAHALTRIVLSRVAGAAASAFRFAPEQRGKPVAFLGDRPAALSFNLSHTEGLVGIAVSATAGLAIGFDLESAAHRKELDFLERYFQPQEMVWIDGLERAIRPIEMLKLWCVREAYIKAIGEGLGADQAAFWCTTRPPAIHLAGRPPSESAAWRFEQRLIDDAFIAAIAVRARIDVEWKRMTADELSAIVSTPGAGGTFE